jgi:ribulose-5-phosphate 4-epimerase/fuculose-1-phosphate aldolase
MLIRDTRFGAALASYFSSAPEDNGTSVEHNVVLMRGHGFTVVAEGIVECVVRAVYTQQNASIQTTALLTRAAYGLITSGAEKKLPEIRYLNAAETKASEMITQSAGTALRPWGLWLREVEKEELYVNEA